jgi:hypothetical protein
VRDRSRKRTGGEQGFERRDSKSVLARLHVAKLDQKYPSPGPVFGGLEEVHQPGKPERRARSGVTSESDISTDGRYHDFSR